MKKIMETLEALTWYRRGLERALEVASAAGSVQGACAGIEALLKEAGERELEELRAVLVL